MGLDGAVTGDDPDESELVERASRGDGGAIDALLERHLPELERFVERRAGGVVRARESTSDLVQSVCRELLIGIQDGGFEYRGEPEFRAWLQAAALNKIRHRARHWAAARREAGREVCELPSGVTHEDATPSVAVEREEEAQRAIAALGALTERDREVIRLAKLEGLGHREIAERLGTSEANSRMVLSRALARLAMQLGSEDAGRDGHRS